MALTKSRRGGQKDFWMGGNGLHFVPTQQEREHRILDFTMAHFILTSSLLLILHSASSLSSSSSPLQGFHSTNSATTTKVSNADLRQGYKPMKPYIPYGLTEEQYRTIKQNELAQKRSMNLGAWGPQFKRMTTHPDNNWFNIPTLWTNGYTAPNNAIATNDNSKSMQQKNGDNLMAAIGINFIRYLRRYGIAYLFILLSTQLLLSSRIISAKQIVLPLSSASSSSIRLLVPLVILKPLNLLRTMLVTKLGRIRWLNKDGATK